VVLSAVECTLARSLRKSGQQRSYEYPSSRMAGKSGIERT
jgi:hypothetical protein